jgi:membrane protein DedA with SNARE-associated domain
VTPADVGLLVLFLVSVVPFAPTEAVLIGAGVLASSGDASMLSVIAVAAAGCTAADLLNFAVGRGVGERALRRLTRKPRSRALVEQVSAKLGEPILVAVRFVPGGGIAGALLAGAMRWPVRRFVPVAVVGATLWTSYTATLGYVGGQLVSEPVVALLLSLGVATAISVPAGFVIRRRRAHA